MLRKICRDGLATKHPQPFPFLLFSDEPEGLLETAQKATDQVEGRVPVGAGSHAITYLKETPLQPFMLEICLKCKHSPDFLDAEECSSKLQHCLYIKSFQPVSGSTS